MTDSGRPKKLEDFFEALIRARFLVYLVLILVVMSFFLGEPCNDCKYYLRMAYFLRGECPLDNLRSPFCYRFLPPLLVSLVPYWPEAVFPLMNLAFCWLGVIVLDRFFRKAGFSAQESFLGVELYIFSFPVLWYAPRAMNDSSAMFFRILGIYLGFTNHYLGAGLAALVGVHTRQDLLAVLIILAIYYFWQKKYRMSQTMIACILLAMASLAAVAYWLRDAPDSFPYPVILMSWSEQLYFNLNFRAVGSLLVGLGLPGALALFSIFARDQDWKGMSRETIIFLLIALVVSFLVPVYAFLVARFDARTVWQTYVAMIPFSLVGIRVLQRTAPRPGPGIQTKL